MRIFIGVSLILAVVVATACAEPEPTFAPPGALRGKNLPGVQSEAPGGGGVFGAAYDPKAFVPAQSMKQAHGAKGQTLEPGACLGCHMNKDGGAGAPAFAYGGRVVFNREGTEPAPNVDVIVVQGDVKLGPVKSDVDGYFWLKSDVDVTDGRTTVRNANDEQPMGGKLFRGYGSCSTGGCHGQKPGQPQVFVTK